MQLRTAIVIAFAVLLLAVWLAVYRADAYAAWVALAAALFGAAVARFYPSERDEEAEALHLTDSGDGRAPGATPNVASAVAAGEIHAATLLEVTMDSMREAVVIIDNAMRVIALNNSARAAFRQGGADSLSPRRLSDLTRNQLLDEVWGQLYYGDSRTLDVHIRRLRQKLGDCGECIETVIGVGYRFAGFPGAAET